MIRINRLNREAATYVKLRKLGYSINILAQAFGRSRSMIWRILKFNGLSRPLDMRKLPSYIRKLSKVRQWQNLGKWLHAWEHWILGQGEKPP